MKNQLYLDSGPSREGMFDSLRLGLEVKIKLCELDPNRTPKGRIWDHDAKIISIKRLGGNNHDVYNHEWEIEVLFKGKFSPEKYELWKGTYSAQLRSGMPIEEN